MQPEDLARLVAEVRASSKYRAVSPELVRTVGAQELTAQRAYKPALKTTKRRLHQLAGAFLDRTPRYDAWLTALRDAAGDNERVRATCRAAMDDHASTRERLAELEHFYTTVFAALPPVTSLMDLACGLNPLAAPWMPLAPNTRYLACDLYADLCTFVDAVLPLLGLVGEAAVCDLTAGPPPWRADVALVLKTLPLLEHVRRGAGRNLLHMIDAPHLVVSFPTRSLGGRNVGMATTYARQMRAITEEAGWGYQTLTFTNEIVFVVQKT